jgi:putative ATPase
MLVFYYSDTKTVMDLFPDSPSQKTGRKATSAPLAERVRPESLDEFVGQGHIVGAGKPLRLMLEKKQLWSMLFWGPPGVGKTTLARLIARHSEAVFHQLNAVSSGVKEVRDVIATAERHLKTGHRRTLLFIDEIHRFNKAQQDALLHSVEEGIITLIGATTENPSFEVIGPLLSRTRVYVLESLTKSDLERIIELALRKDPLLSSLEIDIEDKELLMLLAGGDARSMLNGLETAVQLASPNRKEKQVRITADLIREAYQYRYAKYDKGGEEHYNIISAFIKSMRGSDPDATVYWLARMLEGGEDPKFIARRMVILASEDVGNADPLASVLATSCFTAIHYIGMPEARIILSQCATYLASAPKSNASYLAIEQAIGDVRRLPNEPVPLHLRNAPTSLMKELGYGDAYKYVHDYEGGFVEDTYLPESLQNKMYYKPKDHGREAGIRKRLNTWWKKRQR